MIIVKVGGGNAINLQGVINDLANVDEKFIIVHGANASRDALAERLNQPRKTVTSVSGYSSVLSDEDTIDLQMMAYAGLKNKRIVEMCQIAGINAVGLSGLDGKVIQGKRNRGIKVEENGKKKLLRDFSGKPKVINRHLLDLLMDNGYAPVLCVPIIDENNIAINSENDDIVAVLHKEFKTDKILQLIEAPGFLRNHEDPDSLIDKMSEAELKEWEAKVEGRIKRKLLALVKLLDAAPATIFISDGRTEHPVKDALEGKGTVLTP
ncbi:MAG: [LysW]-aminoadipate kinase [bacterium]|nr:[LysW]-aminoadipate kinase [bacterium]